jgi:hypothetical protein
MGRSRPRGTVPAVHDIGPLHRRGDFAELDRRRPNWSLPREDTSATILPFGRKRIGVVSFIAGTRSKTLRGTEALARTPSGSGADRRGSPISRPGSWEWSADHLRSRPHSLTGMEGHHRPAACASRPPDLVRQHRLNGTHSPRPIRRSGAPARPGFGTRTGIAPQPRPAPLEATHGKRSAGRSRPPEEYAHREDTVRSITFRPQRALPSRANCPTSLARTGRTREPSRWGNRVVRHEVRGPHEAGRRRSRLSGRTATLARTL